MRKDPEVVVALKWTGMMLGISGTLAAAVNAWPLAPILLVLNCAVWAAVGRAWREPSMWITNLFAGGVALVLLLAKLVARAF
ncbi:MAG: hypothetical protein U0572_07595 [Phycisphaerales bacterium]